MVHRPCPPGVSVHAVDAELLAELGERLRAEGLIPGAAESSGEPAEPGAAADSGHGGQRMGVSIHIYFPSGGGGAGRNDLEDDLEVDFFGNAAEQTGAGSGARGSNLDFELADGQNVEQWVTRLRDYLRQREVRPGTVFEVFPEDWEPGMMWLRVEVFGSERWLTERVPK
jgi:hypothetical protein